MTGLLQFVARPSEASGQSVLGDLGGSLDVESISDARAANSSDNDHRQVERACLDYVEAIYEKKPHLIERSVHPDLRKFGLSYDKDEQRIEEKTMTFERLLEIAADEEWQVEKDAQKIVEVLDVSSNTASAKLTAVWGVDYFQLIKQDGKWLIFQIVWQSRSLDEIKEGSTSPPNPTRKLPELAPRKLGAWAIDEFDPPIATLMR